MQKISGPSGSTHAPMLMANRGEILSSSADIAPAHSPKSEAPTRYISQVVVAKIKMKGTRKTKSASDPVNFMIAHTIQNESGG